MNELIVFSSIAQWFILVLNLILTLALIRRINQLNTRTQPDLLPMGSQAPNFTAETLNGDKVSLSDYVNRIVAFVFVSPNCQPCREEISVLEGLRLSAEKSNVSLVLVSSADKGQTASFKKELQISLPILVAPQTDNPFMKDYKVSGTPFFCLLDTNQSLVAAGYSGLEHSLKIYLKEKWIVNHTSTSASTYPSSNATSVSPP